LTNTENYNLNLPDADDFYNIEDINENMETIDAAMYSLEENIGQTAEKVGTTTDTGGSATAGTAMAKLNALITSLSSHVASWTSTRAGYIDNIRTYTLTNNTASTTGNLSQKLSSIISTLSSGVTAKAVKSVQFGKVSSGTKATGSETGFAVSTTSSNTIACYIGITISGVSDINKCQVRVYPYNNASTAYSYPCKLASKTQLRVYVYGIAENANYSNFGANVGFTWEITEFN